MSRIKVRIPFLFVKSRPMKNKIKYSRKPKHKSKQVESI